MGRILIVDDEKDIADANELILTKAGFKISRSSDGVDALSKIINEIFDLVITDIKMPRLSGIELIECLRKSELKSPNKCPIIISSGYTDDEIHEKFSNIGQIYFMPKPVPPAELIEKVRSILKTPAKKRVLNISKK